MRAAKTKTLLALLLSHPILGMIVMLVGTAIVTIHFMMIEKAILEYKIKTDAKTDNS